MEPNVKEKYRFEPYTYELAFAAIAAAGGQQSNSFQVEANSDFILHKLSYMADVAVAAQTDSTRIVPLATVLLTNSGTARQMMNAAVPIPSLFGTGQLPFILPASFLLKGNTTFTAQVTSYVVAGTVYNIRLSFHGVKRYAL